MIDTKALRRVAVDCFWPTSPVPISDIIDRLEAVERAWKESDKACRDLTEKVIPNIREQLESAEKERDELRHCFNEWINKTEWVQRGINAGTISPKYIGLHRADIMASLLGAAEKERDEFKRACFGHISDNSLLRAKIEAMEKQEPVVYQRLYRDGSGTEDITDLPDVFERQRPLYALQGAQPAPSVPDDGFKRAVMEIKDIGYGAIFKHLICERAAELAAAPKPEAKP